MYFDQFVIGPIVLISIIGTILIFYLWNQHKEKMALIKKGDSLIHQDALQQMKLINLARGIIASCLALGVLIAHIIETYSSLNPPICYISMILLFFGVGSLTFYAIIKNK